MTVIKNKIMNYDYEIKNGELIKGDTKIIVHDNLIEYAEQIQKNSDDTIVDLCKKIDSAYHHELGQSLNELRKLLAQRFLTFDIRIDFRKLRCRDLNLAESESWKVIAEDLPHVSNQ